MDRVGSRAPWTVGAVVILSVVLAGPVVANARTPCRCTPRCVPVDPDCRTVVAAGTRALWKHLTTGHWQRPAGPRSSARQGERLHLRFDRRAGRLSITAPSLRTTGHGVMVRLSSVRRIRQGLALRLLQREGGFGDLWALLRDRPQPGPGSHPGISCCQVLKVQVAIRGARIRILGRSWRLVRPVARRIPGPMDRERAPRTRRRARRAGAR